MISTYVDDILIKVCKKLGIEIPDYDLKEDPTKGDLEADWNIASENVKGMEKAYSNKLKELKPLKRKLEQFKKKTNKLKKEL